MKIDKEKLLKLSKLAKIEIKNDEIEKYIKLINNDLKTLEDIDKIDISNIEPLMNPYDMELRKYNDIVSDGNKVDLLMDNTIEKLYNYFVVPKVIDENK